MQKNVSCEISLAFLSAFPFVETSGGEDLFNCSIFCRRRSEFEKLLCVCREINIPFGAIMELINKTQDK
jgi:hypothetical protein